MADEKAEAPPTQPVEAVQEPVATPSGDATPTPTTFTEEQVTQFLAKAQEQYEAKVAKTAGTLGQRIQTLQKTLEGLDDWRALDENQRASFTDATILAQEHAEVLTDKFSLTERQKTIVAKGKTSADRNELAEAMAEGKTSNASPGDKTSLAAMLKDIGIDVPEPGAPEHNDEPNKVTGFGRVPLPQSDDAYMVAAADGGDWDPKRSAEIAKKLGI